MDGTTGENEGLPKFVSNNGLGASWLLSSGDSAGKVVDSSGDSEGMMEEIVGESARGDAAGESSEEVELERVSISTFIPWVQCPIAPQMKYLFPGELRGMVVAPSL